MSGFNLPRTRYAGFMLGYLFAQAVAMFHVGRWYGPAARTDLLGAMAIVFLVIVTHAFVRAVFRKRRRDREAREARLGKYAKSVSRSADAPAAARSANGTQHA